MRRLRYLQLMLRAVLALLITGVGGSVRADPAPPDFTPPPPISDSEGTLAYFAGEWDVRVVQFDLAASSEAKISGFGSSTASLLSSPTKPVLRENSAIHFENGTEVKAISELQYSKEQGAFLLHSVTPEAPEGIDVKAVAPPKARVLEFVQRDPKTESVGRLVVTITSPKSYTATSYAGTPDGNERVAAEYQYSRSTP